MRAPCHRGMRVAPRWKGERIGHITDIACFVPGEEPEVAGADPGPASAPVEMMDYLAVDHLSEPRTGEQRSRRGCLPRASSRWFRCPICHKTYVGGRGVCPIDSVEFGEEPSSSPETGTITNHGRHAGAVPGPDRDRAVRPGLRPARRHRRRMIDLPGRRSSCPSKTSTSGCGSRRLEAARPSATSTTARTAAGEAPRAACSAGAQRRARRRRPDRSEPDLLTALDRHRRGRLGPDPEAPSDRADEPSSCSTAITEALGAAGAGRPTSASRARQLRLHHRAGVRFVSNLDAIGAGPDSGLPRGDGRRLGALRGLGAPPGGRHRDRP